MAKETKKQQEINALMEKAMFLQQAKDEADAELKLTKIRLAKKIQVGETGEFMGYKFSHQSGSVRTTLDQKALKETHPTIFEKFCKETETKPVMKIIKPKGE